MRFPFDLVDRRQMDGYINAGLTNYIPILLTNGIATKWVSKG
jgi:hypothetical protein